ncbi:ligand-binding sensor domain-containing protein [Pedobacter caeni]|uniref:Two component regulator propeller n=1 Tax=Pedobacter caeni TaxID=288992 RepID=A0A1M5LBV5_9SPHI|nr:two-component regulator propeller domain-containing protein [Pedobacter caeni]SHG62450.1 Two component regulator propeller [Pedobacter caeni]
MMKYFHVYALCLMSVFSTGCGQNRTNVPQDSISKGHYPRSQPKENSAGELAVRLATTSRVPVSMVRNVKPARNGDILIASYLGVFRYDGTSFTNLTSRISPARFSSFWDVLEDRKGNLWFGSRDSGVYHYDGKSFQHLSTKNGLASNTATHIYEDKTGNIWIGASRYDGKSFRNFTTKDRFPSNNIRLLLEDKTGKLWFGAQGEDMFVHDGKTFTVLKNKDGKTFRNVWSIIEDKNGSIWFGDTNGLWRYDGRTFTKVSQRGAYGIIQDKKGNIWTTGAVTQQLWALSRYEASSLYHKIPGVTEITSGGPMDFLGLLEANDGSIWFGSGGGVHRYDGKTITDFKSGKDKN